MKSLQTIVGAKLNVQDSGRVARHGGIIKGNFARLDKIKD